MKSLFVVLILALLGAVHTTAAMAQTAQAPLELLKPGAWQFIEHGVDRFNGEEHAFGPQDRELCVTPDSKAKLLPFYQFASKVDCTVDHAELIGRTLHVEKVCRNKKGNSILVHGSLELLSPTFFTAHYEVKAHGKDTTRNLTLGFRASNTGSCDNKH